MSNIFDDKLLADYLENDSPFSKQYRSLDADAVPDDLDRAVLAAARASVSRRKRFHWQRITPVLAIAATTVVTLSIVIRSGVHRTIELPRVANLEVQLSNIDRSVTATTQPVATPQVAAETPALQIEHQPKLDAPSAQDRGIPFTAPNAMKKELTNEQAVNRPAAPAPAAELSTIAVSGQVRSETVQDVAMPVPVTTRGRSSQSVAADSAGAANLEEIMTTASRAKTAPSIGPRGTVPLPAQSLTERKDEKEYREKTPEVWLAYIRKLREENKTRAADREWARFVKAFPDYRVEANDVVRGQQP